MDAGVYNNLLSTVDVKYTTKYVNKPSELRMLVRQIRSQTLSSPLYLVDFTNAKQSYVLGIKESSLKLHDSLQALADTSSEGIFAQMKARSSDTEQVEAELIDDKAERPSPFSLRVRQLANTQVNEGKQYYETGRTLPAGSYQFHVTVGDVGYDFQYNIRKDATHGELIKGLGDFITKAKIGLVATPYSTEREKVGMRIESADVGTADGRESFTFQDKTVDSSGRGIVDYYELNHVVTMPKNALFDLNGNERSSIANEFTLGSSVRVTLRSPSDSVAVIDYRPDSEVILRGINDFISDYNALISDSLSFEQKTDYSSKLLRELKALSAPYVNDLESCGITFDADGFMRLDDSLAIAAVEEGDMQKLFGADSAFAARIFAKADAVKINPMEYVDKKIVTYPDFTRPPRGYSYISSLYSGLLFNSYC